jgi:hypothetical protein
LLKLHFLLKSASLDVWQQERLHQVSDEGLVVVEPPFVAFQVLVHFLFSQVCHDASLSVRSPLNRIVNYPIQVRIDRALIHLDNLFIQALLPSPDDFLGVSLTSLLNLPLPPFLFSIFDFFLDALFLCKPQKFLR